MLTRNCVFLLLLVKGKLTSQRRTCERTKYLFIDRIASLGIPSKMVLQVYARSIVDVAVVAQL